MTALIIPADIAIDDADRDAFVAYQAAVSAELEKLIELGNYQKRRNTVWQLAWAAVTPQVSQNEVFKRKDVVSRATFFGKWNKQQPFTAVLERVKQLTRAYVEGKDARELKRQRDELREFERQLSLRLMQKAENMLNFPLQTATTSTKEIRDIDGQLVEIHHITTIEPTNWRQRDAGFMLEKGSAVGRRALNMTKDKTDITTDGEPIRTAVQVYLPDNGRD